MTEDARDVSPRAGVSRLAFVNRILQRRERRSQSRAAPGGSAEIIKQRNQFAHALSGTALSHFETSHVYPSTFFLAAPRPQAIRRHPAGFPMARTSLRRRLGVRFSHFRSRSGGISRTAAIVLLPAQALRFAGEENVRGARRGEHRSTTTRSREREAYAHAGKARAN